MSVRRLLLFVSLVLMGALVIAACGGDDDSEATPAEAATEEAAPESAPTEPPSAEDVVANLCDSLDNLGAIVNEYQDLSAPPNTIDDVRAINEQVETAFDDVASSGDGPTRNREREPGSPAPVRTCDPEHDHAL